MNRAMQAEAPCGAGYSHIRKNGGTVGCIMTIFVIKIEL